MKLTEEQRRESRRFAKEIIRCALGTLGLALLLWAIAHATIVLR